MHPCPCCGYRTLSSLEDDETCPVCWWEDDGEEPWLVSGPNGRTLVEAQAAFLAARQPYRLRPGRPRPPRRHEARDPDWQPIEVTDEMRAATARQRAEEEASTAEHNRLVAEEVADDPEGPLRPYNDAVRHLRAHAAELSHAEVEERFRGIGREHGVLFPDAEAELLSRRLKEPDYYRHHPLRSAWWLLRFSRSRTFRRLWQELRSGRFRSAG